APCSRWDLKALRSPLMRAKKPRSQVVHEMRGFLRPQLLMPLRLCRIAASLYFCSFLTDLSTVRRGKLFDGKCKSAARRRRGTTLLVLAVGSGVVDEAQRRRQGDAKGGKREA